MSSNVTIDGPAGAGKSTAAKALAEVLGWEYYNTGLIYRAVGKYVGILGLDLNNPPDVLATAQSIESLWIEPEQELVYVYSSHSTHIFSVTNELRTPEASHAASFIGNLQQVGIELVRLMRVSRPDDDFVVEGRNTGSYVFPHALIKFYLDAELEVRKQRISKSSGAENAKLILERDQRDSTRDFAPLCIPNDAYTVDSTNRNLDEVVEFMHQIVKNNIRQLKH